MVQYFKWKTNKCINTLQNHILSWELVLRTSSSENRSCDLSESSVPLRKMVCLSNCQSIWWTSEIAIIICDHCQNNYEVASYIIVESACEAKQKGVKTMLWQLFYIIQNPIGESTVSKDHWYQRPRPLISPVAKYWMMCRRLASMDTHNSTI